MKASYHLSPTPLLLILLGVSTFVLQARPPEPLRATINTVQHDISAAYTNTTEALGNPHLINAKASVANTECAFYRALAPYQLAIDILTRNYGPRFTTLGVAYALRAQILDHTGNHDQALSDYQHALSLLKHTPGRATPAYLTVQLAYSHSLRKCGLSQEASHLDQIAKTSPANVRIQQCAGCTISAESSR